ncbi:hypothetical protein [Lentibacillus salicampi]|uniref:Uncharacterized protein n=1 Tax=Lentibacillus salicampi TaxID=175306 RepID=A0A4Y9A7S8_9BACI|nr:hypothetical protein [Lentibacillus salicampi]TFJ90639.1 hypothetical protein E4U82_19250 [Lentibacillus salicampi]
MKYMLDNSLKENQTLKEFIQSLLAEFNKGENGLAVKYLRENTPEDSLSMVDKFLDYFNGKSFEGYIWKQNIENVYKQFMRTVHEFENEGKNVEAFLVFIMNYVFVSYSNKPFRKAVGIKVK